MPTTNSKSKGKGKGNSKKALPLRIFIKCSWSGARLAIPSEIMPSSSSPKQVTLTQLISTLTAANQIPPLFINRPLSSWEDPPLQPSLVYIHTTVWKRDWDVTTIGDILGKDFDMGGSVLLTLNLPAENNAHIDQTAVAAPAPASVPEPMDVDMDEAEENENEADMKIAASSASASASSAAAIPNILTKNFDADSKECFLTCLKIMDNILTQPTNVKMRTLKLSNAAIQRKILQKGGGLDLLFHIGFDYDTNTGTVTGTDAEGQNTTLNSNSNRLGGSRPGPVSGFEFDGSSSANANATTGTEAIIVLRPKHNNQHLDHILQVRNDIVQALTKELNMDPRRDKIPPLPKLAFGPGSGSAGPGAATAKKPAPSTGVKFDPFKSHSFNTQAAAVGAPNPNAIIPDGSGSGSGSGMDTKKSTTERKLELLQEKQKKLEANMQPHIMTMSDRNIVAYKQGEVGPIVSLKDSSSSAGGFASGDSEKGDGSLVAAQLRRKMEERKKREEGGFTTKAMRDLEKMKKAKVYSHAQLRIYFPDGTRIEAKFLPSETISTVKVVVASTFQMSSVTSPDSASASSLSSSFDLYVSPPRRILEERKTLTEEGLVPAAKIHVSWKAGSTGGLPSQSPIQSCYFQNMAGARTTTTSSMTASFPESVRLEDTKPSLAGRNSGNALIGNDKVDGDSAESKKAAREEELMQRMLGKRKGLGLGLGKKNTKSQSSSGSGSGSSSHSNSGGGGGGNRNNGSGGSKPKWFKR